MKQRSSNTRTILVIDDDPIEHTLSTMALRDLLPDAEVVTATDGKQALLLLPTLDPPPWCIVVDLHMPEMDGHEFLAAYEGLGGAPAPVIVATSTVHADELESVQRHACVCGVLLKPLISVKDELGALLSGL